MKYSSNIKIEDNSGRVKSEANKKVKMILTAIGEKAKAIWIQIITQKGIVDTGRFRGSVANEVKEKAVIIGSDVEYAPFLELGTSRMRARPSLKPAILNHKETYKKLADQIWKS